VLKESRKLKPLGRGSYRVVMPKTMVARQTVPFNHEFHFRLPASRYVLVARYAMPSNVHPFVRVTVSTGMVVRADVPNTCM
jgi:hypothetical protein